MAIPPPRTLLITQSLTSINLSELNPSDRTCAICHEAFQENTPQAGDALLAAHPSPEQPVKLQCGHVFGEACITSWLTEHENCPLCRAVIVRGPSRIIGETHQNIDRRVRELDRAIREAARRIREYDQVRRALGLSIEEAH